MSYGTNILSYSCARRIGLLEKLSTPPATTTLALPACTNFIPSIIASRPPTHWRSIVRPPTLFGKLLARAISLEGLPPAPRAFETINSSTSSDFIPLASITFFMIGAANSCICNEERGPLIGDTIDRFAPTI